jgi:type I restriction enzyme S subunit
VSEKPQYGWTTKATSEGGELKLLRTTDITSGIIDWFTVPYCTEEPEDVEKYLVKSGDILISRAGSVGVSFLINNPERAVFASYLIRFRPKEGVDPKYFYYYLKSPDYWAAIGASKSGIAVPNVNASKLSMVPIPIAPTIQQERIVAVIEEQFSRLDEAVATLKRVKASLKRYKASVLKSAVEGRLTEDWRKQHPNTESANKLLERILAERRTKWNGKGKYKEPVVPDISNLSLLPQGWAWASIDQVAEVFLGKMLDKQKHRTGRQLPYLRNINVRWGRVDTDDLLEMFFKNDELERYGLLSGDVLVCEGGEPGRAAVWDGRIPDLKYQKALHRVRFYGKTEPQYLVFLLEFLANTGRLERWFTGSTIKHFTRESFVAMPICVPPLDEQKEIVTEVDRRLSVIGKLNDLVEACLKRSEQLRRSTLLRAFEGKLVPAMPTDEPAHVLLKELQSRRVKAMREHLSTGLKEVAMVKRITVDREKKSIIRVLKHANRWLSTGELLAKAGYSNDAAPDEMERFYVELKNELQAEPRRIEIVRRNDLDHFRAI